MSFPDPKPAEVEVDAPDAEPAENSGLNEVRPSPVDDGDTTDDGDDEDAADTEPEG